MLLPKCRTPTQPNINISKYFKIRNYLRAQHTHVHPIQKSVAHNISNCQVHEEKDYPNVKALEFCMSCEAGMCYICANDHIDMHHTVDWGFDIFNTMEPPRNEVNESFNAGYRSLLDFEQTKCPCGNPLINNKQSAVCAACGTATCSAECHDKFVQSKGKCLFIRNFIMNEQTRHIHVIILLKSVLGTEEHPLGEFICYAQGWTP